MVFHFVHFEYEKDFWHNLVKFIVYRVSLSSSWSNKKQFQLLYLAIGRLSPSYSGLQWFSQIQAFRSADLSKRKPEIQENFARRFK